MMHSPFVTPQGITIATEPSHREAPPVPWPVIIALGAETEVLKRMGITKISRRTDSTGQEFYVSLGNASIERRDDVRKGFQSVAAALGSEVRSGRSAARLSYVSFTVPAAR